MNVTQLFSWFQKNYPHIIKEWGACDHHYSLDNLNFFHLEGTLDRHMSQVLFVADMIKATTNGSIAALLHDLGKPMTRYENHEKKRVSMLNHEAVSGFMAVEVMEKLSKEVTLTTREKVDIFYAICYHIDFHKVIAQCYKDNSFDAFIARYKGQAKMAEILVQLGISDSLGRFSDEVISPREPKLWTLWKEMTDQKVFSKMTREKVVNTDKPVLEMLIGLPCVGKSTYRESRKGYAHISRDDIIMRLGEGKNYEDAFKQFKDKEGIVNSELDKEFKAAIRERQSIVYDLTNVIKSARAKVFTQTKGYHKKAVLFLEELPVMKQRNQVRFEREGKNISDDVFKKMMVNFTPPSFEEFDEIAVIYKGEYITL